MSNTNTQPVVQAAASEPLSKSADVPAWKELLAEVEDAAEQFSIAMEEMTAALDGFEFEDDVPEDVGDAASDASIEAYSALANVDRKLDALRAAVASIDADTPD